jgi:Cysteine rich repeat
MSRFTVAVVCSMALFSVVASGQPARAQAQAQGQFAYCKADAARLCHGVRPGGGRMLGCLKAHENDLTVGCAKELKNLKAQMGK